MDLHHSHSPQGPTRRTLMLVGCLGRHLVIYLLTSTTNDTVEVEEWLRDGGKGHGKGGGVGGATRLGVDRRNDPDEGIEGKLRKSAKTLECHRELEKRVGVYHHNLGSQIAHAEQTSQVF